MHLLNQEISSALLYPNNFLLVDSDIPARTSSWITKSVLSRLVAFRNENIEVLDSAPYAAAAATMVPSFLNGAVGVRFPDHDA